MSTKLIFNYLLRYGIHIQYFTLSWNLNGLLILSCLPMADEGFKYQ